MTSVLSLSWFKGILVLALISFVGGDLTALEFGDPLEPELTPEEHVRAILSDYPNRRPELLEIGFSPSVKILTEVLDAAGDQPSAVLPPIRALGFMGRPQGAESVARHIGHPDREVRLAVIRSLGQMGKFNTIPLVETALGSTDREERREAIVALGKFATPALLPKIRAAAGTDHELVKRADQAQARIEATLKGIQTEDYAPFVEALIDTPEYEDIVALILFTWRPLLNVLEDVARSPETRERALHLLAIARVRKAGEAMRNVVADVSLPLSFRHLAAQGLGLTRTRSSLVQLVALLREPDPLMTGLAIRSLGQLGDPSALGPLSDYWEEAPAAAKPELRLAISRVAKTAAVISLLAPLRVYQPRIVENVQLIGDDDRIIAGFHLEPLAPYFNSPSIQARRDALLLAATLATEEQAGVLRDALANDSDPLNTEIAKLGLERLKNIPLWERE